VREEPLPPVAAVIGFINAINRGDVDALAALMAEDDHHLDVFDEAPLVGRSANIDVWRSYARAFPRYMIYPEQITQQGGVVAVLGYTTGSHLALPDDEERALRLIWLAEVHNGRLRSWQLLEDTPRARHECGLVVPVQLEAET
jgi:ketosteroid isomerase-like protein